MLPHDEFTYVETTRLMLRVIPLVFSTGCLCNEGRTATELRRLRAELQNMGLMVREAPSADFLESQLLINDGALQVK